MYMRRKDDRQSETKLFFDIDLVSYEKEVVEINTIRKEQIYEGTVQGLEKRARVCIQEKTFMLFQSGLRKWGH